MLQRDLQSPNSSTETNVRKRLHTYLHPKAYMTVTEIPSVYKPWDESSWHPPTGNTDDRQAVLHVQSNISIASAYTVSYHHALDSRQLNADQAQCTNIIWELLCITFGLHQAVSCHLTLWPSYLFQLVVFQQIFDWVFRKGGYKLKSSYSGHLQQHSVF